MVVWMRNIVLSRLFSHCTKALVWLCVVGREKKLTTYVIGIWQHLRQCFSIVSVSLNEIDCVSGDTQSTKRCTPLKWQSKFVYMRQHVPLISSLEIFAFLLCWLTVHCALSSEHKHIRTHTHATPSYNKCLSHIQSKQHCWRRRKREMGIARTENNHEVVAAGVASIIFSSKLCVGKRSAKISKAKQKQQLYKANSSSISISICAVHNGMRCVLFLYCTTSENQRFISSNATYFPSKFYSSLCGACFSVDQSSVGERMNFFELKARVM